MCVFSTTYRFILTCVNLNVYTYTVISTFHRLMAGYKKIHKFSEVIAYFALQSWTFHNNNTTLLIKKMSKLDQSLFRFDMTELNWSEYFKNHVLGIRQYIVKDSIDTIPEAIKRSKKSVPTYICIVYSVRQPIGRHFFFFLQRVFAVCYYLYSYIMLQ